MDIMFCAFLFLILGLTEPYHAKPLKEPSESLKTSVGMSPSGLDGFTAMQISIPNNLNLIGDMARADHVIVLREANLKRVRRGADDGRSKQQEKQFPYNFRYPRPYDPDGYFTTPRNAHLPNNTHRDRRNGSKSLRIHNPLYPVTDNSYGAYAVMLLSLIVFAVGIVGNLAVMCIVWHNYYLKTAWNCILASLAFWDFLVLFFCLPVVIFNELTKRRLLGDLSCRIVPYMEVSFIHRLNLYKYVAYNSMYSYLLHFLEVYLPCGVGSPAPSFCFTSRDFVMLITHSPRYLSGGKTN